MGGSHVWVLRDQGPVPVPVKPGLDDGSLAEISSDQLQAGDKVIVSQTFDAEPRRPAGSQQQQPWRPPGQGMRH
jgi:HlyD family secretion protein